MLSFLIRFNTFQSKVIFVFRWSAVILLPLRPTSLTHKIPQRRAKVHCMQLCYNVSDRVPKNESFLSFIPSIHLKSVAEERYSFIILPKLWQESLWQDPLESHLASSLINFFSYLFWLVFDKAIHLFLLSCSQIGSSSHDSVPVPFHLLPGEWSLSPFQPRSQSSFLLVPIERENGRVIMSSGNEVVPFLTDWSVSISNFLKQ